MNSEFIKKAGDIIAKHSGHGATANKEPYCTLALIDENGYPTASTLTVSKNDGINWLTFCTGLSSNKAKRIAKCNRASVCINSLEYNITLVGTIEVLTDPDVKKEMWYEGMSGVFPDGPATPDYCVLKFTTNRYNLFIDWKEVAGTWPE